MKKFLLTYSMLFVAWLSLNAQDVIYESLYDNSNFTQTLDVKLAAGATAGDVSVTPSGAATYTIPISIPPGTHGVVPQLSIGYNSQSGNGLLGVGWNLSGLSAISRSGKSIAYDNEVSPVKLTNEDFFNLDGNRLVVTGGTNGAAGSTYATKMETFSKVTAYGNLGGGPEYFIVEMKNGMVYEYGNSIDSRFLGLDGTKVITWQLNKIRDQYGNYCEYTYFSEPPFPRQRYSNEVRISEIKYTGNTSTGLLPYNKIKFNYKYRKDPTIIYVAGYSVVSSSVLTDIVITTEDSKPVRSYNFAYGLKNEKSYLKRVQECGSNGKCMNPTIFKYGFQSDPIVLVEPTNLSFVGFSDVFSGDYDGDGISDFLVAKKIAITNVNDLNYENITIYLQKPDINGKLTLKKAGSKDFNSSTGYLKVKRGDNRTGYTFNNGYLFNSFEAIDVNGDGRTDIPLIYTGANSLIEGISLNKIEILSPSPDAMTFEVISCPIPAGQRSILKEHPSIFWGDFDGDSRTDYMLNIADNVSPIIYSFISYPSKQIFNDPITYNDAFTIDQRLVASNHIQVIDFDGDGKNEILFQAPYDANTTFTNLNYKRRLDVFTFRKSGSTTFFENIYQEANVANVFEIHTGDFNGDGKTDLLKHSFANTNYDDFPANPLWEIRYSTGIKFGDNIRFEFPNSIVYPDVKLDRVFVSDYNGDGLSDVIFFRDNKDNDGSIGMRMFINNGGGFQFNSKLTGINYSEGLMSDEFIHGDFNGDGQMDIIDIERKRGAPIVVNNYHTRYYNFFPKTQERLLTNVMNGMNVDSKVEYGLATYGKDANNVDYFKKTGVSSFPINYIVPAMNLAKAVEVPNGATATGMSVKNRTEYLYEDLKVHRGGFGSLGFAKMTVFDKTNEIKSTTEFEVITNNSLPLPLVTTAAKRQTTVHYGQNQNLSESISTNSLVVANGRYRLQTDKVEEWNRLSGGTVTKEYKYDANGNIYEEKTNTNNEEYSTIARGNFQGIGNGVPALPTWQTVSNSRNNNGVFSQFSKNTQYQYYPQGAIQQEKSFDFNNSGFVQTNYEYNAFGNVTKTTLTSPGLPTKISTSTYDAKQRFEVSMTNNAGQTSSKTYYPETGLVKTSTGIDGLTASSIYDGFGRPTSVTSPQGHVATTEYVNIGETTLIKSRQPNAHESWRLVDFLNRPVYNATRIFSLTPNSFYSVLESFWYDNKGLLVSKTLPTKLDNTTIPEINQKTVYDYLNRPLSATTDGIAGATTYAYTFNQGKTTVEVTNNAGQKSSKTTDATGKVISTTDHGGTLTFKYDGRGNQTEVKLSGQIVTSMEYDAWGRQSALVDANAGRTEYEYNAYGELIRQKDAKNNQYTMKYDALGRMWERTGPEGITTTEFITTGVAINEVKKVSSTMNSITEEYEYDTWGRVSKATETIDGVAYAKTFTYNTYNQVLTTTYPSGLVVTNTYNTEGMLTKVMSGAQLLFDATTGVRDAFGHWTQYLRGDGKTNTAEYDSYGTPTRFYTAGVQDLRMNWDLKTGNLNWRQDARRNLKENFTYDNLNRLRTAQVEGLQAYTFDFEDNGNIKSKTDAGSDYFYDAAKFNAVKYVKRSTQTAIPSMQQDITYTAFLRPNTITEGANKLEYTYASDYERRKGVYTVNNVIENTRLYLGDYEINTDKNGVKTIVHYLSAAEAIVVKSGNNAFEYYFPYTDHLGSIVAVTVVTGQVLAEQNFDAWGRKRNPANWTYDNIPAPTTVQAWLYRGFTGHEHLEAFGLINMNARLYDPILGRMLSPDNYVGDAGSQGFNRYSYANNNPLSYVDPDGNNPLLIAGLVSAAFDIGFQLIGNGGNISQIKWGSVGISFVAGATGAWAGQLVGKIPAVAGAISKIASPFWRGAASGAISGAVGGAAGGFTSGYLNGQRGWDLAKATGLGFVVGGVVGGLFDGVRAQRAYNKAQRALNQKLDDLRKKLEDGLLTKSQQATYKGGADRTKINSTTRTPLDGDDVIPQNLEEGRFIDNFDDGATQIRSHDVVYKHGYQYADRVRAGAVKDPKGHNFPYSFDDEILRTVPIREADGSLTYKLAGKINSQEGFYLLGVNERTNTIFHRAFEKKHIPR
jgi:RHS repeat-associated protein